MIMLNLRQKNVGVLSRRFDNEIMVGAIGIEPTTPTVSSWSKQFPPSQLKQIKRLQNFKNKPKNAVNNGVFAGLPISTIPYRDKLKKDPLLKKRGKKRVKKAD